MLGLPIHHVGIACVDIEAASSFVLRAYEIVSDSGIVFDPLQNATVRLFNEGLPGTIELVSGPVVAKLVAQRTTYYHMCFLTPDIESSLKAARAVGAIVVSPATRAILFGGRRVAFVYTPIGLVEFLEVQ